MQKKLTGAGWDLGRSSQLLTRFVPLKSQTRCPRSFSQGTRQATGARCPPKTGKKTNSRCGKASVCYRATHSLPARKFGLSPKRTEARRRCYCPKITDKRKGDDNE